MRELQEPPAFHEGGGGTGRAPGKRTLSERYGRPEDRVYTLHLDGAAESPAGSEPDFAAARTWNRAHTRNVVRFDYATKHQYVDARRNGELDPAGVAEWQREHKELHPDLEVTGMVDNLTCDIAEGKTPPPGKKHPRPPEGLPTIDLPHVPDGTMFPARRLFHVPFEVRGEPTSLIRVAGIIEAGMPQTDVMTVTDGDGFKSGTLVFDARQISPDDRPEQLFTMALIAEELHGDGSVRSGPVIHRKVRLVSAPSPIKMLGESVVATPDSSADPR